MKRRIKVSAPALALALALSACTGTDDLDSQPTQAAPTATEIATETSAAPAPPISTAPTTTTTSLSMSTSAPVTTTTTAAASNDEEKSVGDASSLHEEALPPGPGVGDSFYPWAGNGGYEVFHYDLVLDVDPAANFIDGVTTLHAVSHFELTTINVDLYGLEVDTVSVDGAAADFTRSETELIVQPSAPIPAAATFTIEVAYSGTPQFFDDPGAPDFEIGWFNHDDVVYTANQPSGAMTWFPSNNHPINKSSFTITLTVPEHLTAASNGRLVSDIVADGRRTAVWHTDGPMAAYLAAVYIGEFERHEHEIRDGLLIRDYIPSSLSDEERRDTLDALAVTPAAMTFFEDLIGPHPFDVYGTLVLPVSIGYAMENQTLSLHGDQTVTPLIIAHELAHAWFGNSVSLGDWSDIWLNEGFAHYLAYLFVAEHRGEDIEELMAVELAAARDAGAVPPGSIAVEQLFDFPSIYQRSTLSLHALHRQLGDETFFEIVRHHYRQSAGGDATTSEFLEIVDEHGGAEAVELLTAWLFDPEMPTTLD